MRNVFTKTWVLLTCTLAICAYVLAISLTKVGEAKADPADTFEVWVQVQTMQSSGNCANPPWQLAAYQWVSFKVTWTDVNNNPQQATQSGETNANGMYLFSRSINAKDLSNVRLYWNPVDACPYCAYATCGDWGSDLDGTEELCLWNEAVGGGDDPTPSVVSIRIAGCGCE